MFDDFPEPDAEMDEEEEREPVLRPPPFTVVYENRDTALERFDTHFLTRLFYHYDDYIAPIIQSIRGYIDAQDPPSFRSIAVDPRARSPAEHVDTVVLQKTAVFHALRPQGELFARMPRTVQLSETGLLLRIVGSAEYKMSHMFQGSKTERFLFYIYVLWFFIMDNYSRLELMVPIETHKYVEKFRRALMQSGIDDSVMTKDTILMQHRRALEIVVIQFRL